MTGPSDLDCTFVAHPKPRDGGDYLHRTLWPAEALSEWMPTTVVQLTHPRCLEAMAQTGLLVVAMIVEPDLLEVLRFRQARGLPSIYEISDDFTAFSDNAPLASFYRQDWVQKLVPELCKSADAVQFSSVGLCEKFGALHPTHAVLHNQAWQPPPLPPPRPAGPLSVGWAGMSGHLDDCDGLIEALRPSFGRGQPRRFQSHQLTLSVMTTPRIAERLNGAQLDFRYHAPGSMPHYLQFLSGLDVGVAYLAEGAFAASRSDGRFVELASRGVVPVCSKTGSYAGSLRPGETGFWFSTPEQLHGVLRDLHLDRDRLERVRRGAHAEVAERRNHRAAARERLSFYRSVVERARASHPEPPGWGSPLSPGEGFVHAIDPLEDEMLAALLEHNRAPGPALLARYFELARRAPAHYRLWDALGTLYAQLGLTEHRALIDDQRQTRRAEAFERAFAPPPATRQADSSPPR